MELMLSLETSSSNCGVALSVEGQILAQTELRINKRHASHLLPLIDNLLRLVDSSFRDLIGVAFSVGPGSYTGLRIGAASAKAICSALNIPLLGISTLRALAWQGAVANDSAMTIISMVQAHNFEIFAGEFDAQLCELSPPMLITLTADRYNDQLNKGRVLFCGSAAAKFSALLGTHHNAQFLPDLSPSVIAIATLANGPFLEDVNNELINFNPLYLKDVHTTFSAQTFI